MSLSGEQRVVQFLCVCMLATQQQISELHVCFIMFWFNYISRCSCVPTKFPLKPIGTIVKLVSRATKKAARFFLSECWVGGGRAVEVLMEYFSDTNVCLVCSQIQSISERSGIFMQKCILVFNIEQRTVNVNKFDCMWWLCLRALFKCWMRK